MIPSNIQFQVTGKTVLQPHFINGCFHGIKICIAQIDKETGLNFGNEFNENGSINISCYDDAEFSILEDYGYSLSTEKFKKY